MTQSVLIVDDDPLQRQMLSILLRKQLHLHPVEAENGLKALHVLEENPEHSINLIILDLNMPVMGGSETLKELQQNHPTIPVIVLTGSLDVDDAVQAMKLGATDFILKPYDATRMIVTLKNALRISSLSKEVSRLKHEQSGTLIFKDLIGHNAGLSSAVQLGQKAAQFDLPLLITGETGTGKELFAKAIHGSGNRSGRPFIAINCGAIPSELVESTLFGHEKGAFTGATQQAIGKFREAEGGTIFLDELGELPMSAQVKLLRAIQEKEVQPVGASKTVPISVRIISATNKDLQESINAGTFREDLFFRLNVLEAQLPPLRERTQDIPALAQHFIERFCSSQGQEPKLISNAAMQKIINHSWPGNVRELENTINRAMVTSEGDILKLDNLSQPGAPIHTPAMQIITQTTEQTISNHHINIVSSSGVFKTINAIKREAMNIALDHFDHNITQSAKALGMAKSTFYKNMKD